MLSMMPYEIRRRIGCWLWAALVFLSGLVIPPLWPYVLAMAGAESRPMRRLGSGLRTGLRKSVRSAQAIRSDLMKGFGLIAALLGTGGLWLYSHLSPENFGSCHEVALQLGQNATARECQAYGASEFAVPLGLIAIMVLLLSREGDIEITLPLFGTFKRTRAKEAVKTLQQDAAPADLERRGEAFLESVEARGMPPNR